MDVLHLVKGMYLLGIAPGKYKNFVYICEAC